MRLFCVSSCASVRL
jgi:hypothetical protein